jgi:hypothetical protein
MLAAVQVQAVQEEYPRRTINWKRANNIAGLILSVLVSTAVQQLAQEQSGCRAPK